MQGEHQEMNTAAAVVVFGVCLGVYVGSTRSVPQRDCGLFGRPPFVTLSFLFLSPDRFSLTQSVVAAACTQQRE